MDMENEQPNSSASSTTAEGSSNSSSSNILVNLPMLLTDQANMDTDSIGSLRGSNMGDDANAGYVAPSLALNTPSRSPSPPSPSQPQAPATLVSSDDQIASDSIFVSPLLLNSNSSISDSTTSSTTPSSSSTTTTPPHQEHFTLSSSHQQIPQHHALSSIASLPPTRLTTGRQGDEAQIVPIVQEQAPHSDAQTVSIADTIDASVIALPSSDIFPITPVDEDEDGDVVLSVASRQVEYQQEQQATPINIAGSALSALSETSSPQSPIPPPPPAPATPSLPSGDRRPKLLEFSYSHNYGSGSSNFATNFSNNNNYNKFDFENGSGIIGGKVAKMFSNNDNSSAAAASSSGADGSNCQHQTIDRIKMLYPNVNENETPLPRCWSPHEKCLTIGLAQNNLRVHYKGSNKQHSDAASVRTAHPIPASCGLYYFEVKIISKGKNGYMGIGLTAQQFRTNRLPGWDKQSYGYHGDDGNSFSSSGNGQSYGPTFSTGDIIGCCVNFVNNTCFYTKNGVDLGIAFRDLPKRLYPTVGLQTPGEEVDANFGQEPFKFDQIEDMMKQMRNEVTASIYNFPMPNDQGDPTTLLHKLVISYLVHSGHSQTAEAFAKATSQNFREDLPSIRNRQKILKLVMSGRMGQAIEHTLRTYPGLLENNKNLWFMLKCRQFVEMVNGSDIECCPMTQNKATVSNTTQTTPPNQTSVIQSTKTYQNGKNATASKTTTVRDPLRSNAPVIKPGQNQNNVTTRSFFSEDNETNDKSNDILPANLDYNNDVEMENNGHNSSNGDSYQNGNSLNHLNNSIDLDEEMDVDMSPASRKYCNGIERILEFGKELSQMGQLLEKEDKMKVEDRQMLEDAFSLIAYSNPWSSPLGWQLCPTKRENVCTALNSAILESMNYPRQSPLEICVGHANELLRAMAQASLGACAFINVEDIFPQH